MGEGRESRRLFVPAERKFSVRLLIVLRLPINDFPTALVTAGRQAALRAETRSNFEATTAPFSPSTPVQTEVAYSPRRSLRFLRARAGCCLPKQHE